jgi:cell division protein FtsL
VGIEAQELLLLVVVVVMVVVVLLLFLSLLFLLDDLLSYRHEVPTVRTHICHSPAKSRG